jgi:hypothetical protein
MNSAVPAGLVVFLKPTHLRAGLLSATLVQISFFDGWMPTVLLEKRSAVEGPAVDPRRLQTLVEAPPYPLSSRAKPRDLQFCRPLLEMFFDRVLMQVEVKVCRAYGARTMLGNRCPSPGRAGLMFGGRPYGPQSPDRFLEKHSQDGPAELQIPRLRSG